MLNICDLEKEYNNKFKALKNINLEIKKGELTGLLGPNGAGKSTLLRTICGSLPFYTGKISINGLDITQNPVAVKKKIGYLPENPPLYEDMTVYAFLKFCAELKGLYKNSLNRHISDILAVMELTDRRKQLIKTLSKGLKQRVGLAMALLGDPELLILDEPTVGLDPNQIVQIRNFIKKLAAERTVILSSHLLNEVAQLCRKIVILHKGRILTVQNIDALISSSEQKGSIILKASSPETTAYLLQQQFSNKIRQEDSCIFIKTVQSFNDIKKITAFLNEQNINFKEIRIKEPTLEDVFQDLTG